MARLKESLSGGLNNATDPALLQPGELSDMRNTQYKAGSSALWRAPGRALFEAVTAASGIDIAGLRDIKFDNGDHWLVAFASATLRVAEEGIGGWSTVAALPYGATTLEVAHYNNQFFLLPNTQSDSIQTSGTNLVLYQSATAVNTTPSYRQHGLVSVGVEPAVSTAGGGTFSESVTGYYEYWTTEVAKYTIGGISYFVESAFTGKPSTVYVSATSVVPTVTRPAVSNSATTHWRIYRSPKKDVATDSMYPAGFMIGEMSSAVTAVPDTASANNTGFIFPGNANLSTQFYDDATNANNALADDTSFASLAVAATASYSYQGYYGFSFGGFTAVPRGIEVGIGAYVSSGAGPIPVNVRIGRYRASNGSFSPVLFNGPSWEKFSKEYGVSNDGNFWRNTASKVAYISSTVSGSISEVTLGSSTDLWFPPEHNIPWASTDFGSDFMVLVSHSTPSHTLGLDYVKVKIHHGATNSVYTIPYPTVAYTFGDQTSQVAKNGQPPNSFTGDVYEGCLVVNDDSNPSIVRYSYPGAPDSFPPTYFVDFETQANDEVSLIKVVNNRLVVGLTSSIWRMNYLPSERDASFDRGKAREPISRQYGVVNPMCACVYTMDGGTEELAFVSNRGIHSTDGLGFVTRSGKLDWRSIISLTSTSTPIALINNPEEERLEFYFRNDSYTPETYLCIYLSYARGDVDEAGNFKVSGMVHMRNYDAGSSGYASLAAAHSVQRSDGDTAIYFGYGGSSTAAGAGAVYLVSGTTIPSNGSTMQYTTRRMYLAEEGGEFRVNEIYGYSGSYTGAPAVSRTLKNVKTNDTNGEVSGSSKSRTLGGEKLYKHQFNQIAEGLRISNLVTASAFSEEFLILDGQGFGIEDSGK